MDYIMHRILPPNNLLDRGKKTVDLFRKKNRQTEVINLGK